MKSFISIFIFLIVCCCSAFGQVPNAQGTGFAVADGYVITNLSLLNGSDKFMVSGLRGSTATLYPAELIDKDIYNDLALLKVTGASFGTIPYCLGSPTAVNADVFTVGYSDISSKSIATKRADGKVTKLEGLSGSPDHFVTNIPTELGNNGGPIVSGKGEVVGMVVSKVFNGKAINFAIKGSCIKKLLTRKNIKTAATTSIGSLSKDQKAGKVSSCTYLVLAYKGSAGDMASYKKVLENAEATANVVNGHSCVDLGLSVRWATCNIGASKPHESGSLFSWGETAGKTNYTAADYKYARADSENFQDIGNDIKNTKFDACRALWGDGWRMPTSIEMRELVARCKWEWKTVEGMNGYEVTGPNGKSIFLPAAGIKLDTDSYYQGEYGYYWTSTVSTRDANNAYFLSFYSSRYDLDNVRRYFGNTIRAVTK